MTCPHCGELLEASALVCPACGSDAETGWSDAGRIQELGLPLPLDEEGYREVVEELQGTPGRGWRGWRVAAALLGLVGMLLLMLRWLPR